MNYSDYVKSVMSGRLNMIDDMEEASKNLAKMSKKKLRQLIKEGEKLIRERFKDTSGYTAEYDDINHNPNLNDREIRIALSNARQRYVKQTLDSNNEVDQWNREIREEEERRAKLSSSQRL